ncbi:unnamed protein product [Paramecium primaurelia]|uniref:Tetratricopeptide repeat protein n=1 Tax=Paramecium primaurelia TaxID=5886 RepID=A0A8S1JMB2_PARPR|nr:unnamed protein product [Paramecium primaurelia]
MSYFSKLLPFPPNIEKQEIPNDVNEIIQTLITKEASLQQWESISYALFNHKRYDDFLELMKYLTNNLINRFNDDQSKKIKIRIYNSLSLYYLIQATRQDGFDKASDYFDNVVKNFNLSDRYDFVSHTFSIKGLFSFYKGDKDQTFNYYTTKIDETNSSKDTLSVTPCIGTAQAYFAVGNYKDSLQYLKRALKNKPNIAGKARLGIAYCYYNLEQYSLAFYAFKRVLQLEPQNVEAHIGLAVLAFDKGDYDEYFNRLCKAFTINQNHPITLYHLSEHYLFKLDYQRAMICIQNGLKALDNVSRFQFKEKSQEDQFRNDWSQLKCRYLYLIGLIKQIEGEYEQSLKYYNQAKQYNRNNVLVLLGLSQLYLNPQSQNYTESYKLAEKIAKQYENTDFIWELYKQLAYIQSKNLQIRKPVIETYRKALQYNDKDFETLIEFAQQIENEDASIYYQTAEDLLLSKFNNQKYTMILQKITEQIIFPELYINMGVHLANTDLQKALKSYEKCQQLIEEFQIPDYVVDTSEEASKQEVQLKKNMYQIVLSFNKGILMEQLGDYVTAMELHQQCIKINPYFIDSYVRLSYLQFHLGDYKDALRTISDSKIYYEQYVNHNRNYKGQNPVPMIHGYIAYQLQDQGGAVDQFKRYGEDCYSKIFLMAHDYQLAADKTKNDDQQFKKKVLRQIASTGMKLLQHEPKNIQAAITLILVIAELGKYTEALNLLGDLQEYANQQPRILSNLAILDCLIMPNNNQSAKTYFKKYYEKTNYKPDEHTDLAVAKMYLNNKKYQESANVIKRQILNNPGDLKHRLNLNMVIHQQCYEIQEEKSSYKLLKTAVTYFKCLLKSYEYMSQGLCWQNREQQHETENRHIIRQNHQLMRQKSEDKFNFIHSFQTNFDKLLKEAEQKEKIKEEEQLLLEQQRREKLEKAATQQQQKQEQIDSTQMEKLAKIAAELISNLNMDQEFETQNQGGKTKQGKLSKKEKKRRQKEQAKAKKEDDEFINESDDEDYNSQQAEMDEQFAKDEIGEDSEEQLNEQEAYEKRNLNKQQKKKKKIKQKEVKQKSRLQKQVDISDEEGVYESQDDSNKYEDLF